MNCDRCRDLLPGFVDAGGGSANDRKWRALQAHLQRCAECRRELAGYRRYRAVVHAAAPSPELPPGFWARASSALDRVDATRRQPARPRFHPHLRAPLLGALIAAAALTLVLLRPVVRRAPLAEPLSLYAAAQGRSPEFQTSDPNRASAWVDARLHARMPVLNLELAGGLLKGASILRLPQGRMPALYYATPGGTTVVVQSPDSGLPPGRWRSVQDGSYRFDVAGDSSPRAASWKAAGFRYELLSPEPVRQLLALARTAARHCQRAPD